MKLSLCLIALCVAGAQCALPAVPSPSRALRVRGGGVLSSSEVVTVLEDEGARRSVEASDRLLVKSILAGIFVGCGGTLCAGVGGDLAAPLWGAGTGASRFVFGAIGYPLSIILVAVTGASAFTGNLALAGAAVRSKKATLRDAARMLLITYAGCFVGTVAMGCLCSAAALPAAAPCAVISAHKLELTPLQTLLRGVGGGWLISLAITLSTAAARGGGGLADVAVGVWFPISTYVICDFEHCLANMFFFAAAQHSALTGGGGAALDWGAMASNLLYSTAGNVIGAGLLAGAAMTWTISAANNN